ncbi:MAG: hypothetical protein WCP21_13435, partial [Armatimonadota bacterium]
MAALQDRGWQVTGTYATRREPGLLHLDLLRDEEIGPRDGLNVVLTVDQVIQHIAEVELEKAMAEFHPQAGVIIVSRPKTGEILAMSCR